MASTSDIHGHDRDEHEENEVRLVVRNKQDLVNYLLRKKFNSLSFDDKIFIYKLKPCRSMDKLIVKDNRGNKNRSFNINWYKKYEWLTGSESNNKLYCWNCILFNDKSSTPWISGYCDLKHISESLKKHERSEENMRALCPHDHFCKFMFKVFYAPATANASLE